MNNNNTIKRTLAVGASAALLALASAPSADAAIFAFYDFEDDVQDSSVNSNDGTVTGTTTYSTDVSATISSRSTKSFSFDGSTYISLPHAGIDFYDRAQTTGASFSMWVKVAAADEKSLFSEGWTVDLATDPIYNVQTGDSGASGDDNVRLAYRSDDNDPGIQLATSTGAPFDNTWKHLVFTDNAGSTSLYIDGVFDSNLNYTPDGGPFGYSTLGALQFRGGGTFGELTGLMDEVAFFDTVLTQTEITALAGGANPTAIPEPSSAALLGLGGLALILRRRR